MHPGPCENTGPLDPNELFGDSPFGVRGMAGNVWEWTSDAYFEDDDSLRVQRGGGWSATQPKELRVTVRQPMPPDTKLVDVGVRCVWGLDPEMGPIPKKPRPAAVEGSR